MYNFLGIKTTDTFSAYEPVIGKGVRIKSPYAGRIQAWWSKMWEPVLKLFLREMGPSKKPDKTLKTIAELYLQDAYHSLSIEGYQVTQSLIDQIASGDWDPDNSDADNNQVNAMAAVSRHSSEKMLLLRQTEYYPTREQAEAKAKENGWSISAKTSAKYGLRLAFVESYGLKSVLIVPDGEDRVCIVESASIHRDTPKEKERRQRMLEKAFPPGFKFK